MDDPVITSAVKIAIVEVLDRDGHARATVPIWRWPVTVGRAIDCDVVLDDEHSAPQHASIAETEGALRLRVGETVNGVRLGRRHARAHEETDLQPGDVFQIGSTRLRIRRLSDVLAPERPLAPEPSAGRVSLSVLLPLFLAWNVGEHWVNVDPGQRLMEYVPPLLAPPVIVSVWAGLWAVGSKLVRHRFDYWGHIRIALAYSLAASVAGVLLPVAAFTTGWVFPSRVAGIALVGVVAAMIWAHLTLILPSHRRRLATAVAAAFAVGISLYLMRNYQVQDRVFDELYVTVLPPPSLRLARTVPTSRFIDEARQLKPLLDAHAADDDDPDLPEDEGAEDGEEALR